MKKLVLIALTLVSAQSALAHGFRFESGKEKNSNAKIIFEALKAAAATDSSIKVIEGYYGASITKEDPAAAIQCANRSSTEFGCIVAMKHDRPLGPFETYPLGSSIDPYGEENSFSALVAKALQARAESDDTVEVNEIGSNSQVIRTSEESKTDTNIECNTKPNDKGAKVTICNFTH